MMVSVTMKPLDDRHSPYPSRGPGIIIWIPGYVSNGATIVVTAAPEEPAP